MSAVLPPVSTPAEPPVPEPAPPVAAPLTSAEPTSPGDVPILSVRDLRTYFYTYDGVVKALDGVSFDIRRGRTTGLVGETGCGKSVTAFSITRLIPDPPGRVMSGQVLLDGVDLLWGLDKEASFKPIGDTGRVKVKRAFRRIKQTNDRMSAIRGGKIATIFQEPTQAMNPVFSISAQLGEVILTHRGLEVITGMLNANPDARGVRAAGEELLRAARSGKRDDIRRAAQNLGKVVGSSSFATQAFYIVRANSDSPADLQREMGRALGRLRQPGFARRYLRYQRRMVELQKELGSIYLAELKDQQAKPGARLNVRRKMLVARASNFYFGLWGIRGRMRRRLTQELFWRSVGLLEGVAIANPVQVARGYPHELSGGMLQRVMIAMALSAEPEILFADEPTTALDVTIQAQILELMRELKTRVGTAILLITHDLAVIAEVADEVCVMYAGRIVERGPVKEVFRRPLHPYSQGLLASIPRLDQPSKELSSIPGSVPNLITPPKGCRFHPRCPYAMPVCKEKVPPMTVEGPGHVVACYLYQGPVESS
jgi:peptide/nickel transport system ATP-binding protein